MILSEVTCLTKPVPQITEHKLYLRIGRRSGVRDAGTYQIVESRVELGKVSLLLDAVFNM